MKIFIFTVLFSLTAIQSYAEGFTCELTAVDGTKKILTPSLSGEMGSLILLEDPQGVPPLAASDYASIADYNYISGEITVYLNKLGTKDFPPERLIFVSADGQKDIRVSRNDVARSTLREKLNSIKCSH